MQPPIAHFSKVVSLFSGPNKCFGDTITSVLLVASLFPQTSSSTQPSPLPSISFSSASNNSRFCALVKHRGIQDSTHEADRPAFAVAKSLVALASGATASMP
eukprot:GILI01030308.1.p2 GENE.GILI01030308.1~~GILI01030308.1.p2  ORF type:complete len:102 (+),score=17.03 GILI01030308.1:61-366(+)